MPLVAITSVQLTTPMRTALQEASSLARTLVLSRAVPQRIERQRVNRCFSWGGSRAAADYCGPGVFMHRAQNITQRARPKANCSDRVLHGGDCHVQMLRHMKTCGSELARDEGLTSGIDVD